VPVRYGSGNPEGLNLTGWKSQGKLEKTATPDGERKFSYGVCPFLENSTAC
jgi:hypothetical protein